MQRQSKNPTRNMPRHAMHSTVSRVPSRLSSFVLIVLLVLSATSCRTQKATLTETRKAEQSASLDSSASHASLSEATSQIRVTKDVWETWEQSWLILPLDSLDLNIKNSLSFPMGNDTKGTMGVVRTTHHKVETTTRQGSTVEARADTDTVRKASESRSNDILSERKKSPERVGRILLLWAICIAALFSIGYLMVKHQKVKV